MYIHWVNPPVWVLYILANRDLELSCDECVMGTLGGQAKAPYALTLIAMAGIQSRHLSVCNHFGKPENEKTKLQAMPGVAGN